MVQLIKKGGLRERANRSRSYKGSENTEKTLAPNLYRTDAPEQKAEAAETAILSSEEQNSALNNTQRIQP